VKKQNISDPKPCSKKDDTFFYEKCYKIIVGFVTDKSDYLLYRNTGGPPCADAHLERYSTPVFVYRREKGCERQDGTASGAYKEHALKDGVRNGNTG
jgi:hypothetical protein